MYTRKKSELIQWRLADKRGDGYLGHDPSVRMVRYEYDIEYPINRYGLADRELTPKAAGEYRIALIGDSMTFGVGVTPEQRFGNVWFDAVKDRLPNATLWNLGAPGTGTRHHADMLAGFGREYKFDEVILALFGGNDASDNVLHTRSVRAPRLNIPVPRSMLEWVQKNVHLSSFIGYYGVRSLMARSLDSGERVPEAGIFSKEELEIVWGATERALNRFRQACRGRPLTIWYLPSDAEVHNDVWTEMRSQFGYIDAGRHLLRNRLAAWVSANGVSFIDTSSALDGHPYQDVQLQVDGHWNAKGHRLVAELLARKSDAAAILRRGPSDVVAAHTGAAGHRQAQYPAP